MTSIYVHECMYTEACINLMTDCSRWPMPNTAPDVIFIPHEVVQHWHK